MASDTNRPMRRMDEEDEEEGEMSVREAGRKGGETVSKKYGPSYYSEIGKKAHEEHPDLARRAGEKGGNRVRELIEEGRESEDKER